MQFSLPTLLATLLCGQCPEPSYQTANFVVHADTAPVAQAVAEAAERYRKDFARLWLEKELPDWSFLLGMRDYPADLTCLYAQGHSVARYLVNAKSRKAFLSFVGYGPERGWDEAVRTQYGYENVEQLEQAWLGWVAKQHESHAVSASTRQYNEVGSHARLVGKGK